MLGHEIENLRGHKKATLKVLKQIEKREEKISQISYFLMDIQKQSQFEERKNKRMRPKFKSKINWILWIEKKLNENVESKKKKLSNFFSLKNRNKSRRLKIGKIIENLLQKNNSNDNRLIPTLLLNCNNIFILWQYNNKTTTAKLMQLLEFNQLMRQFLAKRRTQRIQNKELEKEIEKLNTVSENG